MLQVVHADKRYGRSAIQHRAGASGQGAGRPEGAAPSSRQESGSGARVGARSRPPARAPANPLKRRGRLAFKHIPFKPKPQHVRNSVQPCLRSVRAIGYRIHAYVIWRTRAHSILVARWYSARSRSRAKWQQRCGHRTGQLAEGRGRSAARGPDSVAAMAPRRAATPRLPGRANGQRCRRRRPGSRCMQSPGARLRGSARQYLGRHQTTNDAMARLLVRPPRAGTRRTAAHSAAARPRLKPSKALERSASNASRSQVSHRCQSSASWPIA